jgi:hypothetical protein
MAAAGEFDTNARTKVDAGVIETEPLASRQDDPSEVSSHC